MSNKNRLDKLKISTAADNKKLTEGSQLSGGKDSLFANFNLAERQGGISKNS